MHLLSCSFVRSDFPPQQQGIGVVSWAVPLPLLTSRFLREGALTPFRYRNVTFDEVEEVKPVLHELASGEAVELMRMEHRPFCCAVLRLRMRWRYWCSAGAVVCWVGIKKALPDEEEELSQCAPGGIRTPNLLIRSQMLYPLSYRRMFRGLNFFNPSRQQVILYGIPSHTAS